MDYGSIALCGISRNLFGIGIALFSARALLDRVLSFWLRGSWALKQRDARAGAGAMLHSGI
ncbi:hypothetical protein [Rhizobium sp. CNPSo 4039]|uniref:hypothetical protein n=1 Tax=Rhizobium sp. CNPSo 4039 TaxID=3021409 RepID=UPI00254C4ACC|nr:hypothetical protein [Rhizobium sp. CNPSo 4039]MDK4717131.1 hypothetical protein [Rhizobium sp. CNPSo 4039]